MFGILITGRQRIKGTRREMHTFTWIHCRPLPHLETEWQRHGQLSGWITSASQHLAVHPWMHAGRNAGRRGPDSDFADRHTSTRMVCRKWLKGFSTAQYHGVWPSPTKVCQIQMHAAESRRMRMMKEWSPRKSISTRPRFRVHIQLPDLVVYLHISFSALRGW